MSDPNAIRVFFPGNKKVYADVYGYEVRTDQPPQGGGEGSAPSPYALFLASLATCAGIYVKGFCDSRELDSTGIELKLRLVPDAFGAIATFAIDIEVPESFPEKYRSALVHAAEKCAVKKTMQNPPAFAVQTLVKGATGATGVTDPSLILT